MSRLTDALATIGKPLEEEREQSPLDMVKSFLKGAALTTVAGAVGGTAGMSALGGYAQARSQAKRQRRLDEISRAKEMIAAARDEAAINASEANTAMMGRKAFDDVQDRKLKEKQLFNQQVENTQRDQQHLRELQAKLENDREERALREKEAFDRAIERTQREQQDMRLLKFKSEEIGFKYRNAVEEAKRKLAAGQESDAKRRVGQITKVVSQFPINPADEEKAAESAAAISHILRTEYNVQTAKQAQDTWNDLTEKGLLKVSDQIAPLAMKKVVDFFAADEAARQAQNRERAGLPNGPLSAPKMGILEQGKQMIEPAIESMRETPYQANPGNTALGLPSRTLAKYRGMR